MDEEPAARAQDYEWAAPNLVPTKGVDEMQLKQTNWGILLRVGEPRADGAAEVVITLESGSEVIETVATKSEVERLRSDYRVPKNAVTFTGSSFQLLRD